MPTQNAPDFKSLLNFAHQLADRSGPVIMRHFRKQISITNKQHDGGFDPVTAADKGAENVIAKALRSSFPEHGLIGEEHGNHQETARYRWVVDPIDGTRSFIMGSPLWGTLIGLLDGETPLLGLMDQPYTGERFWSDKKAAYARNADGVVNRVRTRTCSSINEATLTTTHPDLFAKGTELKSFLRLKDAARMTRYGGDCYNYALLAAGFVDIVMESGLKGFDIVALIPIIERAGGRVTTWDGKPATDGGRILATGDPELHEKVLAFLKHV
ncbi:MAG TPA: histidinol-phosphatase [Hyphomicrobiaceae bacterium]|nr:histidinol-phosphatase [Hyphomicrobiaceae bacterium]